MGARLPERSKDYRLRAAFAFLLSLTSRQCSFLRRTLLVRLTLNHPANSPLVRSRITCPCVWLFC